VCGFAALAQDEIAQDKMAHPFHSLAGTLVVMVAVDGIWGKPIVRLAARKKVMKRSRLFAKAIFKTYTRLSAIAPVKACCELLKIRTNCGQLSKPIHDFTRYFNFLHIFTIHKRG